MGYKAWLKNSVCLVFLKSAIIYWQLQTIFRKMAIGFNKILKAMAKMTWLKQ